MVARLSADLGVAPTSLVELPGDLFAEMIRAHSRRWTHSDELLALILERLDALYSLTEFVNTKESSRPRRLPPPLRYPRPGPKPKPKYSTPAEVRAFFAR